MTTPTSPKELAARLHKFALNGGDLAADDAADIYEAATYLGTLPAVEAGDGEPPILKSPVRRGGDDAVSDPVLIGGSPLSASHVLVPREATEALRTAIRHIEHMAAWIGKQNAGYSFESLGEDMPEMKAALVENKVDALRRTKTEVVMSLVGPLCDAFEAAPYEWKEATVAQAPSVAAILLKFGARFDQAAPAPSLGAMVSETIAENNKSIAREFADGALKDFRLPPERLAAYAEVFAELLDVATNFAIANSPSRASVIEEAAKVRDKTEYAWVIETGTEPKYYAPTEPGEWTLDHAKACRFARKQDAEAVQFRHVTNCDLPVYGTRVCEHGWMVQNPAAIRSLADKEGK